MTLKLVWLTDLHLLPAGSDLVGYDAFGRLERALDYIRQQHSDADYCVISGDLADAGDAPCYQRLHEALSATGIPYLVMPGNHDLREPLRTHLTIPATTCGHFLQYAVVKNGCRIIVLDTLSDGRSEGELCTTRLDWLRAELTGDPDTPTLLFLHHPPEKLELPALDEMRLVHGGDALLRLLEQFPNVRHMCFGHVHRPVTGSFGRLGFTALRSTTMQAPLPYPDWDWSTFEPVHEAPDLGIVRFSPERVIIQLHPFCKAEDDSII